MADAGTNVEQPFNVEWSDQLIGYSPVRRQTGGSCHGIYSTDRKRRSRPRGRRKKGGRI